MLRESGAGYALPLCALLALVSPLSACGRVPEQALKDEQARARRYRDAYETLQEENVALKARLVAQEKSGACRSAETSAR